MPFKVTHSGGPEYKQYGVHNGCRCKLKAWELDSKDQEALKDHTDDQIILQAMPKVLFIELEKSPKEQYPGLPRNWFPMKPVSIYWCLDADDNIEICRRGFPLVPNFSTTIDGSTGQTMKSSIADLGDFGSVPSHHAAMRGYIALSRVTAADNMLVARSFSPLLFRLGAQPFPSLLFQVLDGKLANLTDFEFIELCRDTDLQYKTRCMLNDLQCKWKCGSCYNKLHWSAYFVGASDWSSQYEEHICRQGSLRECLQCRGASTGELTHICDLCRQPFPKDGYTAAMWNNKAKRHQRTLCKQSCCRPKCTVRTCTTCVACRDEIRDLCVSDGSGFCLVGSKDKQKQVRCLPHAFFCILSF